VHFILNAMFNSIFINRFPNVLIQFPYILHNRRFCRQSIMSSTDDCGFVKGRCQENLDRLSSSLRHMRHMVEASKSIMTLIYKNLYLIFIIFISPKQLLSMYVYKTFLLSMVYIIYHINIEWVFLYTLYIS